MIKVQCTLVKDLNSSKSGKWMFDSGLTRHMTENYQNFFEFKESVSSIQVGNNDLIWSDGYGPEKVETFLGGSCHVITLHKELYVLGIKYNFIYTSWARQNYFKTTIENDKED